MTKSILTGCLFLIPTLALAEVVNLDDLYTDESTIDYFYGDEDDYEKREFFGFNFYISLDALDAKKEKAEAVYSRLKGQLYQLKHLFPLKVMEKLEAENVKIVINDDCANDRCKVLNLGCERGCYVPHRSWLDEFLSTAVVVRDLDYMLDPYNYVGPTFLLHEIAHAFHDLVVPDGFNDQTIIDAWQKAVDSRKYERVNYIRTGDYKKTGKVRHYMLTNAREYFATLSEALWLRSQYEPFVFHQVFADEVLTDREKIRNPVWDAWWDHSGPHDHAGKKVWYWQTLGEGEESISFDDNEPETPNLFDLDLDLQ